MTGSKQSWAKAPSKVHVKSSKSGYVGSGYVGKAKVPVQSGKSVNRYKLRVNRAPLQKVGSKKVYPQSGSSKVYKTVRVNKAPQQKVGSKKVKPQSGGSKVIKTVKVNKAPQSGKNSKIKISGQKGSSVLRKTVRVNKATSGSNPKIGGTTFKPTVKSNGKVGDPIVIAKEKITNTVRGRAAPEDRRLTPDGLNWRGRDFGRRGWDGYGYGYGYGYPYGYDGGYYHGYRHGYRAGLYYGFCYGFCYPYYRYYGPHYVFGHHYGGFGFYHGRWHFVLVLGSPYVHHYHYPYRYSWWDGHYSNLVTWDRAVEVHPTDYQFDLTGRTCVELWIRTTDGTAYEIKTDPRYWDARDPGDLYAALWSELEREGQLQIEDVNGAVHVFPAGLIQQIEARACN